MTSASPSTQLVHPAVLHAMLQARLAETQRPRPRSRPTKPRGARLRRGFSVIAASMAILIGGTYALATHDIGLFELDRNAVGSGAPGDDWGDLYAGGGSAEEFTGIIADIGADGGTQFHGGGSKDDLDISSWLWNPGEPLDKDDITNAYAAAYVNTVDTDAHDPGDLIVYFGLDRFANNGSAQVGFWFLQNAVGLTNIASKGGFEFSGVHAVGDILVQSNFTNGGVISNISVYKWVGGGTPLSLLFSAADCIPGVADDLACGTVNQEDASSPWPFTPKFGSAETFPAGSFFEGGINISALVPDAGCFTGFIAETRSSTPFDSRLKDFALGEFDLCEIEVTKTGDELSKVGDDVDYTITIENTGALTVWKDDISDTLFGDLVVGGVNQADPNAWTSFNFATADPCGASLAPGADCTIEVTRTVQGGDSDPLPNTVTATYRGHSDLSGTAVTAQDGHSVDLFQPSVTVDKDGTTVSKEGDDVTYDYTIENTSSADTPNLILDSIIDTGDNNGGAGLGDLTLLTGYDNDCDELAPGDICSFSITYTVLAGDDDPLNNTVTAHYHPDGFTNDITDNDSHEVELFQPSVDIDKDGTTLSKEGDEVTYDYTIENTSSSDSPDLILDSLVDTGDNNGGAGLGDLTALVGYDADCDELAPGDICSFSITYTVLAGDDDPLNNTVTAHYDMDGFTNDITDSDSHEVELFQPSVEVIKGGPTEAHVGDLITYTFTINNTSSADSPDLILVSVTDTVLGDITADASGGGCGTLAPAGSCNFTVDYTILGTDPDPLVNVVTVLYNPEGFPNEVTDDDDHSVDIIPAEEGCTPGFWQGGFGVELWNAASDADWVAAGGDGFNPFVTTDQFTDFFPSSGNATVDSMSMLEIVGTGGTNTWARKAARDLIAAYLNASFGINYPYSTATILADWNTAVAGGTSGFQTFHAKYSVANELGCPIGAPPAPTGILIPLLPVSVTGALAYLRGRGAGRRGRLAA